MGSYRETHGDLIKLTLNGEFGVVSHGCNCFNSMQAGLAIQMSGAFGCDDFKLEQEEHRGDSNKLGCIDFICQNVKSDTMVFIVNSYTQYEPGANTDIQALTLCLRKINIAFKGKKIGLPEIGCGIGGGDWGTVRGIIQKELCDCDVTVVVYGQPEQKKLKTCRHCGCKDQTVKRRINGYKQDVEGVVEMITICDTCDHELLQDI